MAELGSPAEGIVLTHFIVSDDVERSRRFYTDVLGGRVVLSGEGGPTNVALANSWVVINEGGGPTDDKPAVTLERGAGTLGAQALYRNGTLGHVATAAAARCPDFQETLRGHCRPDWLVYGRSSVSATAAGLTRLAISPSALARTLLSTARREHRAGIRLAIVVTFQSADGGPRISHTETAVATLH